MARFVTKTPVRVLADEILLNDKGEEIEREWVDIKAKLSYGDRNKIFGAIMQVSAQDRELDMNLERYLTLILELSVLNWLLYARDGANEVIFEEEKPVTVPFNRVFINDLDPDDPLVTKITDKIAELNPTLGSPGKTTGDASTS